MATKAKDKPTKAAAKPVPRTRYEDDLYTWVQKQVALLRAGRHDEVDALNVAEKLADEGNCLRRDDDARDRAVVKVQTVVRAFPETPRPDAPSFRTKT